MEYYKSDDSYFAINKKESIIYTCCNTEYAVKAEQIKNKYLIRVIENSNKKETITSEVFVEQFSSAVEYLHTQTPFA